jgi:hypothetical protein
MVAGGCKSLSDQPLTRRTYTSNACGGVRGGVGGFLGLPCGGFFSPPARPDIVNSPDFIEKIASESNQLPNQLNSLYQPPATPRKNGGFVAVISKVPTNVPLQQLAMFAGDAPRVFIPRAVFCPRRKVALHPLHQAWTYRRTTETEIPPSYPMDNPAMTTTHPLRLNQR